MMSTAESTLGSITRRVPARTLTLLAGASAFIFLYYWALLSDGKFLAVDPVRYGLTFNSMIEYMSRGRFDVDPAIILREGFDRDGRTYAYFGVVPALLRSPLLLLPRFRTVDFTVISCAIAATIAAVAQLGAMLQAGRVIGDAPYKSLVLSLAMTSVVFAGSQVQFFRPSIFQESLFWASAIASIFVLLVFRWCVEPLARKHVHLVVMAVVAGFCLLTRVSTSIGLYAACGGIMLSELIAMARRPDGRFTIPPIRDALRLILVPSLILVAFGAICGYINYERWGSPFTFQDYRYYNSLEPNDPALEVVKNYGYFNVRRIPFGFSYFFMPVWAIIGSDGHFLFRALQDRIYYIVELPPASIFASDLWLCFLSVLGVAWLWRRGTVAIDRVAARMVAVALILPGLLMLMAVALTFRYRMEFYPFLEFLGLFGLLALAKKFPVNPVALGRACWVMVAVSVISAHIFMLGYKIIPWGDSVDVEKSGWTAAYREYFHIKYPGIDNALSRRWNSEERHP